MHLLNSGPQSLNLHPFFTCSKHAFLPIFLEQALWLIVFHKPRQAQPLSAKRNGTSHASLTVAKIIRRAAQHWTATLDRKTPWSITDQCSLGLPASFFKEIVSKSIISQTSSVLFFLFKKTPGKYPPHMFPEEIFWKMWYRDLHRLQFPQWRSCICRMYPLGLHQKSTHSDFYWGSSEEETWRSFAKR